MALQPGSSRKAKPQWLPRLMPYLAQLTLRNQAAMLGLAWAWPGLAWPGKAKPGCPAEPSQAEAHIARLGHASPGKLRPAKPSSVRPMLT